VHKPRAGEGTGWNLHIFCCCDSCRIKNSFLYVRLQKGKLCSLPLGYMLKLSAADVAEGTDFKERGLLVLDHCNAFLLVFSVSRIRASTSYPGTCQTSS